MTDKDKVSDAAAKSMMDDLLPSSKDKAPKPQPKTSWHNGGSYGKQPGFRFDDYEYPKTYSGGGYYNSGSSSKANKADSADIAAARKADRKKGAFYTRGARIQKIIDPACTSIKTRVTLTQSEYMEIVDIISREVGDLLEQGNLVWASDSSRKLRLTLIEILDECKYLDEDYAYRKVMLQNYSTPDSKSDYDADLGLGYDKTTGEVPTGTKLDAFVMANEDLARIWCATYDHVLKELHPKGFVYEIDGQEYEMYYSLEFKQECADLLTMPAPEAKKEDDIPDFTPPSAPVTLTDLPAENKQAIAELWCKDNQAEIIGSVTDLGFSYESDSGMVGIKTFKEIEADSRRILTEHWAHDNGLTLKEIMTNGATFTDVDDKEVYKTWSEMN